MKKMLVVYYSLANGNTRKIAEKIANAAQADMARIETVKPYEGSYDDIVSQGQEEVDRGYMPKLKPLNVNIDDYDIIAVGTPTWWFTMAPAVHSFLHGKNWKGKTVIPFMTNGGWPGHVIKEIEKECVGAEFPLSMQVRFDTSGKGRMETSEKDLDAFLAKVKRLL
jgi:flavodoxin